MSDKIVNIGDSILQHGKYNDRIYLMKLSRSDFPHILNEMDRLALKEEYSKIFAKVPGYALDEFIKSGFTEEAFIPNFYNNKEAVHFMAKYFSNKRGINQKKKEIQDVIGAANSKIVDNSKVELNSLYTSRISDESNIPQIVEVYKEVFETYPFPIHEPNYILKTMNENVLYFCVLNNDKIIAVSSSEMDTKSENVEMTDFAVLPEFRGGNLAIYLLQMMENEMKNKGINVSYTIARALSFGMNITFAKMGYSFGGTLINNTNISGSFESMNVWYKELPFNIVRGGCRED